jgi:hypothetical protein
MTDTQTIEIVNLLKSLPSEKVTEVRNFVLSLRENSKKSPAQVLSEIAALPTENKSEKFSGRDHDTILYGEK